jgi:hypothetical protein
VGEQASIVDLRIALCENYRSSDEPDEITSEMFVEQRNGRKGLEKSVETNDPHDMFLQYSSPTNKAER